jgi:hypothetical protein
MNIRQSIEAFFEIWSKTVVTYRWWVVFITIAFSCVVIPQIRHGWVDVSIESFLPQHAPAMVDYNEFRTDFSYAPGAMIVIETTDGAFTLENLAKIKALHEYIEQNVPYLDKATSLANVRYSRGEDDTLVVGDLSEIWPETEADIPAFRDLVLNNPNYQGAIISKSEKVLSIFIEPRAFSSDPNATSTSGMAFLQAHEEIEFSEAVLGLVDKFNTKGFIIRSAGGPTMNLAITKDMEKSTGNSTLYGLIIIIILLSLLFRRASGVILPLLVVFLSLAMTLAIWPSMGYAYNGNTQIIPTFILAVGIADAIHILSIFYKYYDKGVPKNDAITIAIKETAIAVLLTTVTTAASLLSFLAGDMLPTRTMGIFGAIGVIMALFYTLALLPSIIAIVPLKKRSIDDNVNDDGEHTEKPSFILTAVDKLISQFSHLGVNHAKAVVGVSAFLTVLAAAGVMQAKFSHDPVSWYPDGHVLKQAIELVDAEMDGTMNAYVLVTTPEENGLKEPKVLKGIENIENVIKSYHYKDARAVDATSILSVIKETHQSLNYNNPDFYQIPDNRDLVAQEILMFESGSDDLENYADFDFQTARIDIQLAWGNVLNYRGYTAGLNQAISEQLKADGLENLTFKVVGLLPIFGDTLNVLLESTIESYILAFVMVFILMIMLMGNLRGGLIAFAPNIFPILATVGFMGWFNIPLNIITSTIGCVIIGISVDDTIHFMHHFKRYSQQYDDIKIVIHKTLQTCGRAIVFTSVVLVGGFIVHLTGELSTNKEFGWLLSLAIIIALFANLILAPALMMLFWKKNKVAE